MQHPDRPHFVAPLEEPEHPAVPRDSATVVVVRDGARGLEVFMLERHLNSDVLGGAYVFPGGTVDDADRDAQLEAYVEGVDDDHRRALGDDTLGLIVCAIRESFEEAGVLLARHADGKPVQLRDPGWTELRARLNTRSITALELAQETDIRYAADLLRFWHRLATPVQAPKRYDTRFFVALVPEGQEPLHDDLETTASRWIRPQDAIDKGAAGELSIIYPTRKTLETIARHGTAGELFGAAAGRPATVVTPKIVLRDGQPRVALPDGSLELP